MSYPLQSKLLKVLQDKKLTRIGGETEIDVDVRIISTTNKNLADLMKESRFRPDLFYRLNTFPLHLLPLRERVEEIPLLTEYYVRFYNELHKKMIILSQSAVRILRNYPWYGNVRELESFIERLVILFNGVLNESHIRDIIGRHEDCSEAGPIRPLHREAVAVYRLISLEEALEETKKQLFQLAAQKTTNSSRVARLLGISQPSAYRKLKKYVS
jgi:transcriptional regulator with PAS, ATPase and Fis domain